MQRRDAAVMAGDVAEEGDNEFLVDGYEDEGDGAEHGDGTCGDFEVGP